jgi:hypothetical protein
VDPEVMERAMTQSVDFMNRLVEERKRFFDGMHF